MQHVYSDDPVTVAGYFSIFAPHFKQKRKGMPRVKKAIPLSTLVSKERPGQYVLTGLGHFIGDDMYGNKVRMEAFSVRAPNGMTIPCYRIDEENSCLCQSSEFYPNTQIIFTNRK